MQSTQDYIEMRLPASAEYVSLIRLTLSGVFSRAGASYDDIEDSKIAVSEAVTNAVKHASAKHILLQCSQTENIFFMTIEDDGKGFDPTEELNKQGYGLSNIQSRVAYLKGKIEILSSADQQGTSINIELNVTN